MKIEISGSLSLPLNAVSQKLAFIGRTGSGKTYGVGKMVEGMLDADMQVVILDPVGVWYGLRLLADGKTAGYPIPVFGGLKGDIPLEPTGGALVADLIVDRGISIILDVSQFESDADKARFAFDFASRFYFRKKAAPSAVHLVLEECQEFIPQNPQKGEERMLHAFQRMWKLGRNFGIGGTLVSQRPQEVNKKALNQTEALFAFQMTGPQERKAIEAWMSEKGIDLDIAGDLPSLKVGHCHVWSPQWLRVREEIRIAQKKTFNSSSTPDSIRTVRKQELAPIDLTQLSERMKETIERARAEDPKALRAEIAKLKREAAAIKPMPLPAPNRVEVPMLTDKDRALMTDIISVFQKLLAAPKPATLPTAFVAPAAKPRVVLKSDTHGPVTVSSPEIGNSGLRRMMIALAQRPGLNKRQLGVRAGMSSGSGTFGTYMGKLRSSGWLSDNGNGFHLTPAGIDALGSYEPLPEGRALLAYWLSELGNSGAARILRVLADNYPAAINKEELGRLAEISPSSGTFGTYLGKLRSLELINGSRELKASDEFFE